MLAPERSVFNTTARVASVSAATIARRADADEEVAARDRDRRRRVDVAVGARCDAAGAHVHDLGRRGRRFLIARVIRHRPDPERRRDVDRIRDRRVGDALRFRIRNGRERNGSSGAERAFRVRNQVDGAAAARTRAGVVVRTARRFRADQKIAVRQRDELPRQRNRRCDRIAVETALQMQARVQARERRRRRGRDGRRRCDGGRRCDGRRRRAGRRRRGRAMRRARAHARRHRRARRGSDGRRGRRARRCRTGRRRRRRRIRTVRFGAGDDRAQRRDREDGAADDAARHGSTYPVLEIGCTTIAFAPEHAAVILHVAEVTPK